MHFKNSGITKKKFFFCLLFFSIFFFFFLFKLSGNSSDICILKSWTIGKLEKAEQLVNKMIETDKFSYGAMISCYAKYGKGEKSIELFEEMTRTNFKPNANHLYFFIDCL